jgi:predicted nucleic acid-binding protein
MPIIDTVALFAAADPSDRFHGKATAQLRKLGGGLLLGTFALMEFDVVLKSRGFPEGARREEMTLLALDFPGAVTSVHPVTPKTLYLAALYEEKFALGYFDSLIAAEASEHDGTIVSTDREFDKIPGLRRVSLD